MSFQTAVIDYGIGNVHSVMKGLRHEGGHPVLTADPVEILRADRVVLPGVGAFGDGMRELRARDLIEPIFEVVRKGTPFLGICLGMQLLLSASEEFGSHEGLGIIPGKVVPIRPVGGAKVPQIGWNTVAPAAGRSWSGSPLRGIEAGTNFYFVHSFTAVPDSLEHRLADTEYDGFTVSAAIARDQVFGFQFHPEKSGPAGLRVLRDFLAA